MRFQQRAACFTLAVTAESITPQRCEWPLSQSCCFTLAAGEPGFSSDTIIVGQYIRRAG